MNEQAPAKAQTEIGPTTYTEDGTITQHGPNDPETQAAYANGHPSEGATAGVRMEPSETAPSAQAPAASAPVKSAAPKAARAAKPSKSAKAAKK